MNLNNLLNQFLGSNPTDGSSGGNAGALDQISSKIPGGLMGGAAAGGIVALLMGNKSARKFAGKAMRYGGAAVLGGLAFKAYQNWKHQDAAAATQSGTASAASSEASFHQRALQNTEPRQDPFELTLIKAMIAAARADGHINATEQQRIFETVEQMQLSGEEKGIIFDYLKQDFSIHELVAGIDSIEQKTELYLASCLVMDPDHPSERSHLDRLGGALGLPVELAAQLEAQASQAMNQPA